MLYRWYIAALRLGVGMSLPGIRNAPSHHTLCNSSRSLLSIRGDIIRIAICRDALHRFHNCTSLSRNFAAVAAFSATHPCRGDRDVAGRMLLRADSLRGGGPPVPRN